MADNAGNAAATVDADAWVAKLCDAVAEGAMAVLNLILADPGVVGGRHDLGRAAWEAGVDPLQLAARLGETGMVAKLVRAGVHVDSVSEGHTALHWAVDNDRLDVVKLLLELGADATLVGREGSDWEGTPLDLAYYRGDNKMANVLERHLLVKKLRSGRPKEEALAGAEELQGQIDVIGARKNQLGVDKRTLQEEFEASKAKLEEEDARLSAEIAQLRGRPDHKSEEEMEQIREELREIEEWRVTLREAVLPENYAEVKSCPLCLSTSDQQQVFGCPSCDNWVCGRCHGDLLHCPKCRQDWRDDPAKRNLALEKVLARL